MLGIIVIITVITILTVLGILTLVSRLNYYKREEQKLRVQLTYMEKVTIKKAYDRGVRDGINARERTNSF